MRKTLMIVAILALVVVIAGCSGSGDGDPVNGTDPINGDPLDPNLVGIWQLFEAVVDGAVTAPGAAMDWDEAVRRLEVEFGNDGAFAHRAYGADGTELESEEGTWTAVGGGFSIQLGDDEPFAGAYQVQGNILTVTAIEEGIETVLRWAKVVELTERDPQLARTWLIDAVAVNGVGTAVGDFFGWNPDSDAAVLIFQADGTMTYFELEGDDIRGGEQGNWATGGGSIHLQVAGGNMRGAYEVNSASVTFLDTDGSTVKFDLSNFVQEGSEWDEALLGMWQAISVTVDDVDTPLDVFFEWEPGTNRTTVQFFPDGTVLSIDYSNGDFVSGDLNTWNTDGGVLTINTDEVMVMDDWSVVDDTATLTFTADHGVVVVLVFERV